MPSDRKPLALACSTVFDGEHFLQDHCVVVHDDAITEVLPVTQCPAGVDIQHLEPGILAPGFIDLQVNGGGNVLFNNAPELETIKTMQAAHRVCGTTSILPTILSDTHEIHQAALAAVSTANSNPGIPGIHIEGPFFNPEKRGAHGADHIREPMAQDIDWLTSPRDFVVMVTLAPEVVPLTQIKQLTEAGVIVCAGHTNASYEQLNAAAAQGLRGVTHLFNAMSTMTARQPGVLGAALDNNNLWAGIIADGHHVHPAGIRLAHTSKPSGKLILVSDAMATVGGDQPSFELFGEKINESEGRLVNADGVLAGSAIGLIDAVRYAHLEAGITLQECLRMASLYPATQLGLEHTLGRIASGHRADLVHFDDNFLVHNTWLAGQEHSQTPMMRAGS